MSCVDQSINYSGLTKAQLRLKGRSPSIQPGSVEEELIADWMEVGTSFRYTTFMVNQHRREEGEIIVGQNAIMNHFDHIKSKLNKVMKCSQTSHSHQY